MNIQIYCGKKNFDAQKAERYFKERRIPFQALDLKKHKLGEREIRMMISAIGIEKLIDRDDKKPPILLCRLPLSEGFDFVHRKAKDFAISSKVSFPALCTYCQ